MWAEQALDMSQPIDPQLLSECVAQAVQAVLAAQQAAQQQQLQELATQQQDQQVQEPKSKATAPQRALVLAAGRPKPDAGKPTAGRPSAGQPAKLVPKEPSGPPPRSQASASKGSAGQVHVGKGSAGRASEVMLARAPEPADEEPWTAQDWQGSWSEQGWSAANWQQDDDADARAKGFHQKVQVEESLKPRWQLDLEARKARGEKLKCNSCGKWTFNFKTAYHCPARNKIVWDHLPDARPCDSVDCRRHDFKKPRWPAEETHYEADHDAGSRKRSTSHWDTEEHAEYEADAKKRRISKETSKEDAVKEEQKEEAKAVKEEEEEATEGSASECEFSQISESTVVSPAEASEDWVKKWVAHLHRHFENPSKTLSHHLDMIYTNGPGSELTVGGVMLKQLVSLAMVDGSCDELVAIMTRRAITFMIRKAKDEMKLQKEKEKKAARVSR